MATSVISTGASASSIPPPVGMTWTGDWDEQFNDRVFGTDPVPIGPVAALLTGLQHRDGSTVSGVALRVQGVIIATPESAVTADLTPTQARELADALSAMADRAEALDGLG